MDARWFNSATVLLAGLLSLTLISQTWAAPALRPDMVASLERMQSRLDAGDPAALADDARAAAQRLQGGNAADRWARALFLQIAANAELRRDDPLAAAELLSRARGLDGIEREYRRRWLRREARLRLRAGQTARGVELLGQWLEQGDAAGDDDRWLMAQGLAQLERWDTAAKWVDRARGEGNVANDRYLQLAASIYQAARGARIKPWRVSMPCSPAPRCRRIPGGEPRGWLSGSTSPAAPRQSGKPAGGVARCRAKPPCAN